MTDQSTYQLKRLLELFQETWAECYALRRTRKVERAAGDSANWEKVFAAAQTKARELFRPALLDLGSGAPLTLVLEQLLERLEWSRK